MALRVPAGVMAPLLPVLRRMFLQPEMPFATQRSRSDLVIGLMARPPRGTKVEPFSIAGVSGVSVLAPGADPRRRVVHLHGGGYCVGSHRIAHSFAAAVSAAARCRVLVPDYRLAPEHPFPAALEDSLALWRALAAEGGRRPALMGDSAGAGLAVATTLALRTAGEQVPVALALVCPYVDLTEPPARQPRDRLLTPEWLWRCAQAYAGAHDPADPLISPLSADAETLAGLPPIHVVSATHDTLAPQATRFVAQARAAGVEVEHHEEQGLWHDFPLQAGIIAAADQAAERIGRFLSRTWGPRT